MRVHKGRQVIKNAPGAAGSEGFGTGTDAGTDLLLRDHLLASSFSSGKGWPRAWPAGLRGQLRFHVSFGVTGGEPEAGLYPASHWRFHLNVMQSCSWQRPVLALALVPSGAGGCRKLGFLPFGESLPLALPFLGHSQAPSPAWESGPQSGSRLGWRGSPAMAPPKRAAARHQRLWFKLRPGAEPGGLAGPS